MKICWDNLENMRYSKKTGKWYNGSGGGYIEVDSCGNCGESFLSREGNSKFCSFSCRSSGKNNPMYGKTHTDEVKKKLSNMMKKNIKNMKNIYGVDNISQLDWVKEKKGQFIINKKNISQYISKEGYELLSIDGNNKYAVMKLKCPNNHIFEIKWHSFKTGHRCVECFYDKLRNNGIKDLKSFELYKQYINNYTRISYKNYYKTINPLNLERGRGKYHLDHKYSKAQGFRDNIPSYIIGSYVNLQMLSESENCSKMDKCSITKGELFYEYFK